MGRRAKNKMRSNAAAKKQSPSHTQTFQTLISAIQSSQGLKAPFLNSLYGLLVHLSLNESVRASDGEDSLNCMKGMSNQCGAEENSEDKRKFTEILFNELDFRFRILFSALSDVSANRADELAMLRSNMWAAIDELTLLLRCCMMVLALVNPEVLLEKTRVLLSILGKLISLVINGGDEKSSIVFEKFVSRECSYHDDSGTTSVSEDFVSSLCILEASDPCRPILCAVLEVFADELSMHRILREYFMLVDSASGTSRALFRGHFVDGDIGSMLEVISAHFILSLSDEQAFENFLNRLSCRYGKYFRAPELSLSAAVSLLLNPIILSTPKLFQAHLILLVSEAIHHDMSSEQIRPYLVTCYLTTFERSVILYNRYMSTLHMDGHPIGSKGSHANPGLFDRGFEPSFECYIQEITRAKIYDTVVKSDSFWNLRLCNTYYKEKPDLLAEVVADMSKSQQVFDESCKNDILSILSSIIHGAFSDSVSDTLLYKKGETSSQDIYLLAAILKLMSSSLSAGIRCLRHDANLGCLKAVEDASSCKEYDFIVDAIGCFRHFNVSLPNQKKLFDMMETHLTRNKTTKWMLLHFSGLLSLSFASGIDFLVNSCVSTLMTLMNLYLFEEGSIVALRSLLVAGSASFTCEASCNKVGKALVNLKITQKIVSNIHQIKEVYLSSESVSRCPVRAENEIAETSRSASIRRSKRRKDSSVGIEESSNGEVFLKCLGEDPTNTADLDDLVDFVECKSGKDYSSWLKSREIYRKWRSQKMAVLSWEKRKRTWKFMTRK